MTEYPEVMPCPACLETVSTDVTEDQYGNPTCPECGALLHPDPEAE